MHLKIVVFYVLLATSWFVITSIPVLLSVLLPKVPRSIFGRRARWWMILVWWRYSIRRKRLLSKSKKNFASPQKRSWRSTTLAKSFARSPPADQFCISSSSKWPPSTACTKLHSSNFWKDLITRSQSKSFSVTYPQSFRIPSRVS